MWLQINNLIVLLLNEEEWENEENVLKKFGVFSWSGMEHMWHVCFRKTSAVYFVVLKYFLTKSDHKVKEERR